MFYLEPMASNSENDMGHGDAEKCNVNGSDFIQQNLPQKSGSSSKTLANNTRTNDLPVFQATFKIQDFNPNNISTTEGMLTGACLSNDISADIYELGEGGTMGMNAGRVAGPGLKTEDQFGVVGALSDMKVKNVELSLDKPDVSGELKEDGGICSDSGDVSLDENLDFIKFLSQFNNREELLNAFHLPGQNRN